MDDTVTARSPLAWMLGLIKLMSPKQWAKNGIVLAPLVSSGTFVDAGVFNHTLLAVLLCCFASPATYIINDMHGIERGRRPLNKSTACPLAAGVVMVSASLIRLACLCRVLIWCRLVAPKVVLAIAACMLLNLAPTNAANVLLA